MTSPFSTIPLRARLRSGGEARLFLLPTALPTGDGSLSAGAGVTAFVPDLLPASDRGVSGGGVIGTASVVLGEVAPNGGAALPDGETAAAERTGYLYDVFVREDWRGEGVGRALVAVASVWAQTEGCASLALHAPGEHAHAFYAALGAEDAEGDGARGKGDGVAMVLSLGGASVGEKVNTPR